MNDRRKRQPNRKRNVRLTIRTTEDFANFVKRQAKKKFLTQARFLEASSYAGEKSVPPGTHGIVFRFEADK